MTAAEQKALLLIYVMPQHRNLFPRTCREAVSLLNEAGLVWLKGDVWNATDRGEVIAAGLKISQSAQ